MIFIEAFIDELTKISGAPTEELEGLTKRLQGIKESLQFAAPEREGELRRQADPLIARRRALRSQGHIETWRK
jgi:hypothetical protein